MTARALETGSQRVGDVRESATQIEAIAKLVGLPATSVRRRLARRHGAMQVRRALRDVWPSRLDELGDLPAARIADAPEFLTELALLLRRSKGEVASVLRASPRQKTRTVLADAWPNARKLSRDQVLACRVVDVRRLGSLAAIAKTLDLDPKIVGRRLDRVDGRTHMARAFADLSAGRAAPTQPRSLAQYVATGSVVRPGGMATVTEARDAASKKLVMLKRAHPGDPALEVALRNEFQRCRDLAHPHLVKYLDELRGDDGRRVLVIEHGGRALDEILRGEGPFKSERALAILEGVADALDYLRDRRVAHLDVTPRNIVVDSDDRPRLIDFGIARGVNSVGGLTSTQPFWNQLYSAPEVGNKEGDRADQYSLAMVSEAMRLGPEVLEKLWMDKGREGVVRAAPPAAARALSSEPRNRFDSASDFVAALAKGMSAKSWLARWLGF